MFRFTKQIRFSFNFMKFAHTIRVLRGNIKEQDIVLSCCHRIYLVAILAKHLATLSCCFKVTL